MSKSKYFLTAIGIFLLAILAFMALNSGRRLKPAMPTPKESVTPFLPVPQAQNTGLVIAEGRVKSSTSQELVLETSGKEQKFKVLPETRITLLIMPQIEISSPGSESGRGEPPPPAKPKEIKISDLKAGDEISLVYKSVGSDLVAQSITVTRAE